MDHNNILAVVLAGGKSKRFGDDKTQAQLGGKILIDYILSEIVNKFNEVLIVANDPIKHLSSDKIVTIEDFKKNLGPLGGILSAKKWVNNIGVKTIDIEFDKEDPFFNVNTKEDLEKVEKILND